MRSSELLEDIRSLWDLDRQTIKPNAPADSMLEKPSTQTQTQAVTITLLNPSLNTTEQVPMHSPPFSVAITNNGGSPVNTVGNNNTVNQQVMQTGIDAAQIKVLLDALSIAVAGVSNPTAKAGLTKDLKDVEDAVQSKTPDKSKITGLLDRFKDAPKYIEASQAVADAATKLYNYVVPMLSTVPPSLSA